MRATRVSGSGVIREPCGKGGVLAKRCTLLFVFSAERERNHLPCLEVICLLQLGSEAFPFGIMSQWASFVGLLCDDAARVQYLQLEHADRGACA